MAHSLMYWHHPLHDDTPADHQHGQPAEYGMPRYELHIERCPEVEHHDGWHIPERQFVVQPEAPVDGDIQEQVEVVASLKVEALQIVDRRHYEPCREEA